MEEIRNFSREIPQMMDILSICEKNIFSKQDNFCENIDVKTRMEIVGN